MDTGAAIELRDLRNSKGKALLPGGARAHLPAMLWRTAGSDAGLPERLSLSAAGAGACDTARSVAERSRMVVLAGRSRGPVHVREGTSADGADVCAGEIGSARPQNA